MATKKTAKPAIKRARVLIALPMDGVTYRPNQIIRADAVLIDAMHNSGQVDADPSAVKYCVEQGADIIDHTPVAA